MLAVAHVHIYGQNRLHVNLCGLSKISGCELARCAQQVPKKQALPPDISTITVGQCGGNSDTFCPKTSLTENKTSTGS